jgi:hypothetical protein
VKITEISKTEETKGVKRGEPRPGFVGAAQKGPEVYKQKGSDRG